MPITINGSGTLTGVSTGGLPDGIVDTDMLANDAVDGNKISNDLTVANNLTVANDLTVTNDLTVSNDFKLDAGYGSNQKAYGVRVWCNINSSHTIQGSGGITSVTDNGTGDQIYNFSFTFPDTNYCPVTGTSLGSGPAHVQLITFNTTNFRSITRYDNFGAYNSTVTLVILR